MDFFNIGSGEVLFIILLAILLIGPKRAVEFVQQGSRLVARLRQEWFSVQREVIAEVNAIQQQVLGDVGKEVQAAQEELLKEAQAVQQEAIADLTELHE